MNKKCALCSECDQFVDTETGSNSLSAFPEVTEERCMSAKVNHVVETVESQHIDGIAPGCVVQLQFQFPNTQRISARLIGYETGKYLVVRLTEPEYWKRFHSFLFESNPVVVRLLVESERGQCVAFHSAVKWRGFKPIDLLYLEFPAQVQKCDLRLHKRVSTCISANVIDSMKSYQYEAPILGHIRDVSLGGCCFEFELPMDRVGVSPRAVDIKAGKEVLIQAEIRNQRTLEERKMAVGLRFRSSLTETKKLLSSLYISPELLASA